VGRNGGERKDFEFLDDKNIGSSDGEWTAVGDRFNYEKGSFSGKVVIKKKRKIFQILYGTVANDYFGASIAISDNALVLAVGAYGTDYTGDRTGSVYIYSRGVVGDAFQLQDRIDGEATGDLFGKSIAMARNGLFLVVVAVWAGISNTDTEHGSLSFYTRKSMDVAFQMQQQIYGECDREQLGIHGVAIESTYASVYVHAKSGNGNNCITNSNNVRSYKVGCECSNEKLECKGYNDYPNPMCRPGT